MAPITILDRYIAKEVLASLFGVTLVLMLIFVSARMVRYLAKAAEGDLPGETILLLLGLKSVEILVLLLPLALYLAILLVQGRMYRDSEMVAIGACGVSLARLYRPLFLVAVPVSLLLAAMSLFMIPWSANLEQKAIEDAQKSMEIGGISAGQFRMSEDKKRLIYVEEFDSEGGEMQNVFIQVQQDAQVVLLSSERAYVEDEAGTGDRYLIMLNGHRYEGRPGNSDYKAIQFRRHSMLLRAQAEVAGQPKHEAMPTSRLLVDNSAASLAELQWRISVPVSALLLTLLALPLGKVDPRQGRYGKLFIAVLVYSVYVNVLALAKGWTEREVVPSELGLWWVHLLVLFACVFLNYQQMRPNWFNELFNKRKSTRLA